MDRGRNRNRRRGARDAPKCRRPHPRQFADLEKWVIERRPTDLVLFLEHKGFVEMLAADFKIKEELMVSILKAFAKSCESDPDVIINKFISAVLADEQLIFFRLHVSEYLQNVEVALDARNNRVNNDYVEEKLTSIHNLLVLLRRMQSMFPNRVQEMTTAFHAVIRGIRHIDHNTRIRVESLIMLNELEEDMERVRNSHQRQDDSENVVEPPNDYRSLTLVPTFGDIHDKEGFLRKNIIDKKYQNVDHYLDVHFRLMREDFIRPLRRGIGEYLKNLREGKRFTRLNDVFLYPSVVIYATELCDNGILFRMKMDMSLMPKIKWKTTKRLLPGSLLCLSWNNFDDFIFGTASGRKIPAVMEKGFFDMIVDASMENDVTKTLNEASGRSMVMIEPLSYFEAYRHVLLSLQQLTPETFPFKKYIVEIDNTISPPEYLSRETTYDLSHFLTPLRLCETEPLSENSSFSKQELIYKRSKLEKIQILKDECWPSYDELGVDRSQFGALKHALTKELAIVQGPPGTGKTYIGLRIVQTLLQNSNIWNTTDRSPILISCYTNHALDQFLEGILPFCNEMVRIGGRCKSETLNAFTLRELKKTHDYELPYYVRNDLWECRKRVKFTQELVNINLLKINKATKLPLPSEAMYSTADDSLNFQEICFCSKIFPETFILDICDVFDYQNVPLALNNEVVVDNGDEEEADEEEVQRITEDRDDELGNKNSFVDFDVELNGLSTQHHIFIKHMRRQLLVNDVMDIETARTVKNLRRLSLDNRWRFYRLWVKLFIAKLTEENNELLQNNGYLENLQRFQALRTEENLRVLLKSKIVGVTTTGAAKNRELLLRLKPKIAIIEEAAEVLESHIITSITSETKHMVLIGDHMQLRPNPTVYELAMRYNLDVSLFERLVNNGLSFSKLGIQHRMHPRISEFLVPLFYNELEDHEMVKKYGNVKGVAQNMFFVNHSQMEAADNDSKSKSNAHESQFISRLCKYLVQQGYKTSQITVLTTYSAQLFKIRSAIKDVECLSGMRVSVVDNFQGEENDIIILSFVRSNTDGNIGFLSIPNRVNVAMSRAKIGFFGIGNFDNMARNSEKLWQPLVHRMKQRGNMGPALELFCQNHPETRFFVSSAKDFNQVPEGCCLLPCNAKLVCGHVCPKTCHVDDSQHKSMVCPKKCLSISCQLNHRCQRRCHFPDDCGKCMEKVPKEMPNCGHFLPLPCSQNVDDVSCVAPCTKFLVCGHRCGLKCGDLCDDKRCRKKVPVKPPCGHTEIDISCCDKTNGELLLKKCREPCEAILECGHRCRGTCGECIQGRFHKKCGEKCERVLLCGHICKHPCAMNCPPCDRVCDNRCFHTNKCIHKCGNRCPPCKEQCGWRCDHLQCRSLCFEQCDRDVCNEPCNKRLKCDHPCIGICGEKCPEWCRVCHKDKVENIFFGFEDEPDARFIELYDCHHIFEIRGITRFIKGDPNSEESVIQKKSCPQCRTVIRKSRLFSKEIKIAFEDIEKVKERQLGTFIENRKMATDLVEKVEDLFQKTENSIQLTVKESNVKMLKKIQLIMKNTFRELLRGNGDLNKLELENMSNIIEVIEQLIYLLSLNCGSDEETEIFIKRLAGVLRFLNYDYQNNNQQILDLTAELNILNIFSEGLKAKQKVLDYRLQFESKRSEMFFQAFALFSKIGRLSNEEVEKMKSLLKEAFKVEGLGISLEEKEMVLKAMGFSQKGHWFKCPNGHIYSIGECGGAMQVSRCPECKEEVGGTAHRLLSTNSIATEMDGARMGAYDFDALHFNPADFLF